MPNDGLAIKFESGVIKFDQPSVIFDRTAIKKHQSTIIHE